MRTQLKKNIHSTSAERTRKTSTFSEEKSRILEEEHSALFDIAKSSDRKLVTTGTPVVTSLDEFQHETHQPADNGRRRKDTTTMSEILFHLAQYRSNLLS